MKVADLENGSLYQVQQCWTLSIRIQRNDDVGQLTSAINMLSIAYRQHPRTKRRKPYPVNPPMIYLGVKHLSNKVWGMKKYHWFLVEGKEVGLMGHDVRSLKHV